MQRSLRFSEFDFVIEHKAGTKISHVDAMSRHVGAIMEEGLPDKEQKHSFCNSRKSGNPSRKSEYFLDEDGVLYKRRNDRNHHLVVPHSLIRHVIRVNDDPVYVAHPRMKNI
jgi:hypothetical protein